VLIQQRLHGAGASSARRRGRRLALFRGPTVVHFGLAVHGAGAVHRAGTVHGSGTVHRARAAIHGAALHGTSRGAALHRAGGCCAALHGTSRGAALHRARSRSGRRSLSKSYGAYTKGTSSGQEKFGSLHGNNV
jgi:hypothetical protein